MIFGMSVYYMKIFLIIILIIISDFILIFVSWIPVSSWRKKRKPKRNKAEREGSCEKKEKDNTGQQRK